MHQYGPTRVLHQNFPEKTRKYQEQCFFNARIKRQNANII